MNAEAKRLRALLERGQLNQVQAAKQIGIGERMMRHYTAGNFPVPRYIWLALERVIEMNAEKSFSQLLVEKTKGVRK